MPMKKKRRRFERRRPKTALKRSSLEEEMIE